MAEVFLFWPSARSDRMRSASPLGVSALRLVDVVDCAERIPALPGLVFMNTPGYDPLSLTGFSGRRCQRDCVNRCVIIELFLGQISIHPRQHALADRKKEP